MGLAPNVKQYLSSKYKVPKFPGSFSGAAKFYRSIRKDRKFSVFRKQVQIVFQSQYPYTLLRKINRKFRRNKVITPYRGYLIDADTAHLVAYNKQNDGNAYILSAIDTFTKQANAVPVKILNS